MREILAAASGQLQLNQACGGGHLQVVSVLPDMVRTWTRADAVPVVAMQPAMGSDDLSVDLATWVLDQLGEDQRQAVEKRAGQPGRRLRLQDLVDPDSTLELKVYESFEYWAELDPKDEDLVAAAKESQGKLDPIEQVLGLDMAFWTVLNGRAFLRWSLGIEEEELLDALARLQAKRQAGVVSQAKYVGAFRALGTVIPVWELPGGTTADDLAQHLPAYQSRLEAALKAKQELDYDERRARAGLVARSLTLR